MPRGDEQFHDPCAGKADFEPCQTGPTFEYKEEVCFFGFCRCVSCERDGNGETPKLGGDDEVTTKPSDDNEADGGAWFWDSSAWSMVPVFLFAWM